MLEFLRRQLAALQARLESAQTARAASRALADGIIAAAEARAEGARDLTPEEQTGFDSALTEYRSHNATEIGLVAEIDQMTSQIREAEEADQRTARANEAHERNGGGGRVAPTHGSTAAPDPDEVRNLSRGQRRDHAMRMLERAGNGRGGEGLVSEENQARIERMFGKRSKWFDGDIIAERMLVTENPYYRSAFTKYANHGVGAALTPEESRAVAAFQDHEMRYYLSDAPGEQRAASEGTTTAGGFGVPIVIDPTIILTSGAADIPLLRISRVEQITNQIWKGVSSVAPSWSFDAEAAEVSDDMTALAQPTVTAYAARGFIPYSFEIAQDYPNWATEIQRLLEQGYLDLIALKTAAGSGTSEPWGIFPAIVAGGTTVQVVSTTDGAFGGVDVFNTWNALQKRFRDKASWFMSVSVESAIRQFAAAAGSSSAYFTVDLSADGISKINGRPVYLSDYAPALNTTTGAASRLVVGDFQNFVIAQRAGMTFETVQHLFATANNLPSLSRGRLGWARIGSDSVADNAFRVQVNT